jgi:hypothetical protein
MHKLDSKYVTKAEFNPVRLIAYGLVSVLLVGCYIGPDRKGGYMKHTHNFAAFILAGVLLCRCA